MDELNVIRTAHEIDGQLEHLVTAVKGAALQQQILDVKTRWQVLTYELAAAVSGARSTGLSSTIPRRRGRPRKQASDEPESNGGTS